MFNNLTKEIVYYSLIPFIIVAIVALVALFLERKKDTNFLKRNYFTKVLLFTIIGIVLPLITGYTIWIVERFINKGLNITNILYILLLACLIISLVILLIVLIIKSYKGVEASQELASE